jgi:hypothetical protein
MGSSSEAPSTVLPTSWAAASAVSDYEIFPNTSDGTARSTFLPPQLDVQMNYGVGNNTAATTWYFAIWQGPNISGAGSNVQINSKVIANIECFPFEETAFLFDDAISVGRIDWLSVAFQRVQALLGVGFNTMKSVDKFLETTVGKDVAKVGKNVLRWAAGAMGIPMFAHRFHIGIMSCTDEQLSDLGIPRELIPRLRNGVKAYFQSRSRVDRHPPRLALTELIRSSDESDCKSDVYSIVSGSRSSRR